MTAMDRDPLKHYIAEALVAVFFYEKGDDKLKGFIALGNDTVKNHVTIADDALSLTVEGFYYVIDADFYDEYGVQCADEEDLAQSLIRFRKETR